MIGQNKRLYFGIIISFIIMIFSLVSTIFNDEDSAEWYTVQKNLEPSFENYLGSSGLGQDILFLLSDSILHSLLIGVTVALFSTLIGVILGILSGFIGGVTDKLLIFLMDAFTYLLVIIFLKWYRDEQNTEGDYSIHERDVFR